MARDESSRTILDAQSKNVHRLYPRTRGIKLNVNADQTSGSSAPAQTQNSDHDDDPGPTAA